jgi:putative DNA primase/helicase
MNVGAAAMSGEDFAKQHKGNGADHATIPPVVPLDAWTFINMEITPRSYVVEPWLPEKGLAMVHASAGVGKTWFALYVAQAITTGSRFLKWSCPQPRRVLYVDGEMSATEMQGRLASIFASPAGADLFQLVTFDLYDGPIPNLATEEGQQRIKPAIDQAEVIVLDNLSCLVADGGRSDAETWDSVQPWLLALRRSGKTVIMLHHSGKSGAQRGTSKRADPLDAVIRLGRPPDATSADGARFIVTFEKARGQLGKIGEPFEAMLVDGAWSMAEDDRDQLDVVVDLTLDGKSIRKIAEITGLPKTRVNRLQKIARERGML